MKNFVLDASMTLAWLVDRPIPPRAEETRRLLLETRRATAPPLWQYEVLNGFVMARRRGRITQEQLMARSADLEGLREFVATETLASATRLTEIAEERGLTVYDAAYLEVALRRKLCLATLDRKLEIAARKMGVDLV